MSWILKQPLKHFNIPKNQHDDKMLSVIEQCKLDKSLLPKSEHLKWRTIPTFMDCEGIIS